MKRILLAVFLAALAGCGTTMSGKDRCASQLDAAWKAMEVAKVDGFAGTVSFAKAVGLLTSAKTQQTLENFARCADEAERSRFYLGEARKGR